MLGRVEDLREANPMLGLRGVRLGLKIPELMRMQTRAIVDAALEVRRVGVEVRPEIMVPLVSHASEMAAARADHRERDRRGVHGPWRVDRGAHRHDDRGAPCGA